MHFPRPPKLSWRGRTVLTLSVAVVAYCIGFALYISTLPTPFSTLPDDVEGLAVFTGGSGRVDAALNQLYHGFTGPILISGRHPRTHLSDILAESPHHFSRSQRNQISIDSAQTTHQNIQGLQTWATQNHISNISIITSTYHAARVRLLASWFTNGLQVRVLAVQPADAGLRPLFLEYNKLLSAPFLP